MNARLVSAAGYVLVFVLGGAAGAAYMQTRSVDGQVTLFDQPGRRYATYLWSLDRKLKLTPTERQTIEGILARYEPKRQAVLSPVDGELSRLRAEMRKEIRDALDPAKRTQFEELTRKYDEERGRRPASLATPEPQSAP